MGNYRDHPFVVGDRVTVKQWGPRAFKDSTLQRIADTQRPGTVTSIVGTANVPHDRSYRVQFDPARKGIKPIRWDFRGDDIVPMEARDE